MGGPGGGDTRNFEIVSRALRRIHRKKDCHMNASTLQTRAFGKTGIQVTIVGLGGEGILRTYGREPDAGAVIREALDQGIAYYDCARAYAGSEGYYGLMWSEHPEARSGIFQAGKSAERSKKGALADLDDTLSTMHIQHLDLWQIHDVRTEDDFHRIDGPEGALEAFLEAKAAGKARFIGVTGHHDPEILTRAVREWPVDSVLLPVNPVEGALGGFLDMTLPAARKRGIAVIGMKVLGASHYLAPQSGLTADVLIRFALSQAVDLVVVGCASPEQVRTLANIGKGFEPLTLSEQNQLVESFRPYARRLAYYRGAF
jgi:predicted aldo/keto reductase-like oxidoreductase